MKFLPVSIFLIFCLFARIDRFFLKQNGSFSQKFTIPDWSRCPQFTTEAPENLLSILDQSFTYLTKGKQSFVFLSEDQNWVLKLVRLPRFSMRFSHKGKEKSLRFLKQVLENYKWAQEELSEETGVIYSHLKPTNFLNCVSLIDRMGVQHDCDLNDQPFFIQKYGEPFFDVFEQNPKELIEKTISLYKSLYNKGFIDNDPIFDKNFGVIDGETFIIDIGQIRQVETLPSEVEYLSKMTQSLAFKLQLESPELFTYYKNLLH